MDLSQLLKKHQPELLQHGVESLAVFGSLARGEASQDSDIDLLVEFNKPVGLFEFIRLKFTLEGLTGRKVDLVTRDALRPALRETILNEAVYVAWTELEDEGGGYFGKQLANLNRKPFQIVLKNN